MKLLLTAFDPFGGELVNPALEAVKRVCTPRAELEIIKLEVPTVFYESIDTVLCAMRKNRPDAVLCVGQAGGRFDITPEKVAINLNDARIPDNKGNQLVDTPVFADGPAAYFATLPVKAMAETIRSAGIPASVSYTAGTFVCNHLMYGILYHIEKEFPGVRGGFLHVPYIPEQVVRSGRQLASLSLEDIIRAVEIAVECIYKYDKDIFLSEGREC